VALNGDNAKVLSNSSNKYQYTLNSLLNNTLGMAKFDGIKGQELLDIEESKDEITLIFKDNRFLFIKISDGRLVCDSVPE
jgi:hypothetical protein